MVEKVPAFRSNSGKLFLSEEAAVRSEAIERLCEIIPEFALIRPRIESNLDAISQATASLVSFKARNHPEPAPENHPENLSDLRSAAIGEMQSMGAPARDWLTRNGFSNVREFCDTATRSDVTNWQEFVGTVRGVKQVYIDNRPVPFDTSSSYRRGGVNEPKAAHG